MDGDFDAQALFEALDAQRVERGLSWAGVAKQIWELSAALNARRRNHPISPSTLVALERRGMTSCQHALFMLRWLGLPPEAFVTGPPVTDPVPLPEASSGKRLRWNLARLYAATDAERQARGLTWPAAAREVGCTPSQLTGLRTARFATNMRVAMRLCRWLGRPSAEFVDAARW